MNKNKITLSIESGIDGGSLSILEGSEEIDFWIGAKNVSRAEELLREISVLLKKNDIKKTEIGLIAVSNSAGSYTGIRIGLATALGLKKAFGCRIVGISVLEAIALTQKNGGAVISAVSINGRDVFVQTFEKTADKFNRSGSETELIDFETFCRKVLDGGNQYNVSVNEKLYEFISPDKKIKETGKAFIFNAGKNLAKFIGRKAQESNASDNVKQVYIRGFR